MLQVNKSNIVKRLAKLSFLIAVSLLGLIQISSCFSIQDQENQEISELEWKTYSESITNSDNIFPEYIEFVWPSPNSSVPLQVYEPHPPISYLRGVGIRIKPRLVSQEVYEVVLCPLSKPGLGLPRIDPFTHITLIIDGALASHKDLYVSYLGNEKVICSESGTIAYEGSEFIDLSWLISLEQGLHQASIIINDSSEKNNVEYSWEFWIVDSLGTRGK